MPKWLHEIVAPTLMLWLYAVAFSIAFVVVGVERDLPLRADLASRVALPLIMASWVTTDARKRGRRLCYDYASFVFFAWPIVNHALQRTAASRSCCNRRVAWPPSLSLGR